MNNGSGKGMAWGLIGLIVGGVAGYMLHKAPAPTPTTTTPSTMEMEGMSEKAISFNQDMRELWEEHVTWTRLVILAIVDEVPGADQATARLLQNSADMEAALTPFYGAEAAGEFGELLEEHLTIAADFVKASKAGDTESAATLEASWFTNADELAAFLSTANPKNWNETALKDMLYQHLALTKGEAVARLTQDYAGDIEAYDEIQNQALMMADALSDGIMKQFPNKF